MEPKNTQLKLFLLVLFLLVSATVLRAQIDCKFISGEKSEYVIGDLFTIQVQLTVDPKSCQDGMAKTGIFSSGISIVSKSEWLELKTGLWQISLKCKITGNKKGFGQLTVIRKTDKQNLFRQVKFEIRKHEDKKK